MQENRYISQSNYAIESDSFAQSPSSHIRILMRNEIDITHPKFIGYATSKNSIANNKPLVFIARTPAQSNMLLFILIAILGCLAYYYRQHNKSWQIVLKSMYNNRVLKNEIQHHSSSSDLISIGMFILSLFTISIFAYQYLLSPYVCSDLIEYTTPRKAMILISLSILGLFIKLIVISFTGFIIGKNPRVKGYIKLIITSVQTIGLLILPVIIIYRYAEIDTPLIVLKIGFGIGGFIYLYRILRIFIIGVIQNMGQALHIILYICAFEISPLIIIAKVFFT